MPSAYSHNDLDVSSGYHYAGDPDQRAARALLFAGTVLGVIGVANLIQGIGVLAGSRVYPANAVFPLASERTWGWLVVVAGVAELAASFAIFTRSSFARWFGVAVGAGNAVSQLFVMPAQPLWAIAALAADVLLIKALVVHGSAAPLS